MDKVNSLTPSEYSVLVNKATEPPFKAGSEDLNNSGTYLCRQCGLALFRSESKFLSGCGWPSFDDEIENSILREADPDGKRTEILCSRCKGHLGHIFIGEQYTDNNQRYCVNSLSIDFVANSKVLDSEEAIFAGGCFWGVAHLLQSIKGVLNVIVGYTGGQLDDPTYEQVCTGGTGHFEAVRVIYDHNIVNYTDITKLFLEIHDPYQADGQGLDISPQYRSAIFYYNDSQQIIAQKLLEKLKQGNRLPATIVLPVSAFWVAEKYHQDYFVKNPKASCWHKRVNRF